ncbi:MAG TPA: LPS assembly protein LptD [Devosiaceae bacterium]|nr:LPS assembly protein LptD [Devosiaceae bacterium]
MKGMPKRALLAILAVAALAAPASAADSNTLLPTGFFDRVPRVDTNNISVSSDQLTYDADHHQAIAVGNVVVDYQGYHIVGDHLVFDQRAKTAHFVGNVIVHAPDGTVYTSPDMKLSGPMNDALMRDLTITTPGGALVTAANGDMQQNVQTELENGTYSPCGKCIDSKGRRIGWSAKAVHMIYNNKTYMVTLDQPTLYLLGIPVAWLPWMQLPDPTKRIAGFRMPSIDSSPQFGAKLSVPYFVPVGQDTDLIFTPSLFSKQGAMMGFEWDQRFPNGAISVKTSGIYQLDPSAYAGLPGDRQWRGAFQTTGQFKPIKEWTVGWSYTAFTDPAYLIDYRFRDFTDTGVVNQVYATKLSRDEFFDFRLQKFNLLGDITQAQQDAQGAALPNMTYSKVLYLPKDMGEVDLSADLLGVTRAGDDNRGTLNGVPYEMGYAENKAHGTVEADWQKRYIAPGGVVVTPYAGLRTDAAYYDGQSLLNPGTIDLFNATPIAAVDVRYPLIIRGGPATQVVEPIAQLYYRGSDVSQVGITNDNAQSFIFDDTNLFSYNRFSGTDLQETGLRANLGGHYQANFDNGNWLDILGGQSFQLAGPNAYDVDYATETTTGQGLSSDASYVVLGATGSPLHGLNLGSKLQVDPTTPRVTRGGLGSSYTIAGYTFDIDYLYIAQDLSRGVLNDQHEVGGGVTIPIADYWKINTHASWDLANNNWLDAGGGVTYDDGYLTYGGSVEATGPTNIDPNDFRVLATLQLKGLGS